RVCGRTDGRGAEHEMTRPLRAQRAGGDREVSLGDRADELVEIGAHRGRRVLHRVEIAAEPGAAAALVEEPTALGPGRAVAVPRRVARAPRAVELIERAVLRPQPVAQGELRVHG